MKFRVELEDKESFYGTFAKWCEDRKFPVLRLNQIDSIFVCYNGDVPIYSCLFWNTGSAFCVLGFPVGNPNVDKETKEGGLTYLFDQMSLIAKDAEYEVIWTTSDTVRVVDSLKESGFKVGDTNVSQYYKALF